MNRKKRIEHQRRIIFVSLLEALISFIVAAIIFLERMNERFIVISIFIALLLALLGLLFWNQKDLNQNADIELDMDIQFETIKNNLIIFLITILPFYVFLTIFRFQPIWIQFGLSVLLTIVVFILHTVISTSCEPLVERIKLNFSISGPQKWVVLFVLLVFSTLSILLFNVPEEQLGMRLNLVSTQDYFDYRGIPVVLESNKKIEQSKLITVAEETLYAYATDYQIIGNLLYLYISTNALWVYDLTTGEKLLTYPFSDVEIDQMNFYHQYRFVVDGDALLICSDHGFYQAVETTVVKLSDAIDQLLMFFRIDGELYLLQRSASEYRIYRYDHELVLHETLPNDANRRYIIISDTLFILEDNRLTSYTDAMISFPLNEGDEFYKQDQSSMLISNENQLCLYRSFTDVSCENTAGNFQSIQTTFHDDFVLTRRLENRQSYSILFINNDLSFSSLVNVPTITTFWAPNVKGKSYLVNSKTTDQGLEVMMSDFGDGVSYFRRYIITEAPVAIVLPFYSHFSIWVFLPILIALFVPLTNYRKTILVIDFQYAMRKKTPKL